MKPGMIGAVIVGGEHPGLGIARSLGQKGIPVCVIDDQGSISEFSRYVDRVIRVKDLREEASAVESLLDAGERHGLHGWVLFPTRDETVAAISRNREKLSQVFRVTTPAWETIQWAWNKKNTYELAAELNIPVPRTYNPKTESELAALYGQLPLAVKPAVKENFFYATGAKAWRADTPKELHRLYNRAIQQIPASEILVQEIIPGNGERQYSYCALFRDGRPHGTLVARRARQHPHEFGRAATYVETMDLREIEVLAEKFLKAIDYHGLVEVEFKQDPRDGQFKLLDVNARTWGFHSLGAAAGVDFPYLLYADQVGEISKAHRAKPGIGWLRLVTDFPTVVTGFCVGRLSVSHYLQSLRNTRVESVFSTADPLPFFGELLLLPYLVSQKYFARSRPKLKVRCSAGNRLAAEESAW
ncbi:MAG TPA: hypothetical protein VJO35_05735 [Terriglobales bacterium]|nr:hypothetical protein [Terriglobales bacterium]